MKRLLFALALRALMMQPTPPRQPMVQCGDCKTWNRADAARCISCNRPI